MKIPFGLRLSDQRMVDVREVLNGVACGCICSGCRRELVAKQGAVLEWHFAHASGSTCGNAVESALHRMAKQLIVDRGEVYLPELVVERHIEGPRGDTTRQIAWQETLSFTVQSGGLAQLSDCRQEVRLGERKPDLYAQLNDFPIAVEVAFTHVCDEAKISWFKGQDLTAIEIDISPPENLAAGDALRFLEKRLFEASCSARWLHHAREAHGVARLDEMERQVRNQKKQFEAAFYRAEAKEIQKRERLEAFKTKIKEIEAKELHIGNLTLRLAYSELRATLRPRVARYSRMDDDHWSELLKINDLVGGEWNQQYKVFEFRRATCSEAHVAYLELLSIVAAWIAGPQEDLAPTPLTPHRPVPRSFASADDMELFEELSAIKEFEGGMSREAAEREAYCEVMQRQADRQLRRIK